MSGKQPAAFDLYIDRLADQVNDALRGDSTLTQASIAEELSGLAKAGFREHHEGPPLSVLVENRVLEKYQEPAIHRRAELTALLHTVSEAWRDVSNFTQQRP